MKRLGRSLALLLLGIPGVPGAAPLHPEAAERLARLGLPFPLAEPALAEPRGLAGAAGTHGRRADSRLRLLVLLVDFDDLPADRDAHDPAHFEALLFGDGDSPHESLREYYREASYGRLEISGEVHGWFRMPLALAEYAGDHSGLCRTCFPRNARGLATAAMAAALEAGVDPRRFDDDGPDGVPGSGDDDGILDGLLVAFSGLGAERTGKGTDLRSHYGDMTSLEEASGIRIPDYALFPERENVGVAVHEFGHVLGAEDLYDVSGRGAGLGMYSVMANGMWLGSGRKPAGPDPYTRIQWGFVAPEAPGADQDLDVPPVGEAPFVLRLWTRGEAGPEYFLVENRRPEGLDAELPGAGLLVYHVDETRPGQTDRSRYRVGLVEADGRGNLAGMGPVNQGEASDYVPGPLDVRVLGDGTTPSLRAHDGSASDVGIRVLDAAGATLRIEARVGVRVPRIPNPRLVVLPEGGAFSEGFRPGEAARVTLRLENLGGRIDRGVLHVFATDPRVRPAAIAIPVAGVPALGALDLEGELPVRVEGVDPGSPAALPLEARLEAGGEVFRLAAPLPLDACVVALESFEVSETTAVAAPVFPGSSSAFARTRFVAREGEWSFGVGGSAGYPPRTNSGLVLGPYRIRESAEIRFEHLFSTQAVGPYAHDGVFLEASRDGGRTWETLDPDVGYPMRFTETSGNPYPGHPAWAGSSKEWKPVVVPVVGFEGETLFRFHFVSDYTEARPDLQGWFLDAFQVRTWEPARVALFEPPLREPGGVRLEVRLLAMAPSPVPRWVRLVRESGGEVVTLAEWPGTATFERRLLVADALPGRGARFRIEWDGRRSQEVVMEAEGVEPLLSRTPPVLRFSEGGWIAFRVPGSSSMPVRLDLVDVRGGLVARLDEGIRAPGDHAVSLPAGGAAGRRVASGVYFLRLAVGETVETRRLVLIP